jgi:LysM repeat protein
MNVNNFTIKAQEAIENLNIKILFSPTVMEDAFIYEVQAGDSLAKIAKKFNKKMSL